MNRLIAVVVVLFIGMSAMAQTTQPATQGMREWLSPAMIGSRDVKMREYLVRRDDLERQYTQAKQNMPDQHPTVQKLKRELDDLRDRIETYTADYNVKTPQNVWLADRDRQMRERQAEVRHLMLTLNDLKQHYQFTLRDLTQDLHDKAIKLSVDGMGTPGRVSTKEIELTESLKRRMALVDSLAEARAELERLKKNTTGASFASEADKDLLFRGYIQQIDEIDLRLAEGDVAEADRAKLSKRKEALEQKAQKRTTGVIDMLRATRQEELEGSIEKNEKLLAQVTDQYNHAKQDLGDLSCQMSQYLTAMDEAKSTRQMLDRVSTQLQRLSLAENQMDSDGPGWREIERDIFGGGEAGDDTR